MNETEMYLIGGGVLAVALFGKTLGESIGKGTGSAIGEAVMGFAHGVDEALQPVSNPIAYGVADGIKNIEYQWYDFLYGVEHPFKTVQALL